MMMPTRGSAMPVPRTLSPQRRARPPGKAGIIAAGRRDATRQAGAGGRAGGAENSGLRKRGAGTHRADLSADRRATPRHSSLRSRRVERPVTGSIWRGPRATGRPHRRVRRRPARRRRSGAPTEAGNNGRPAPRRRGGSRWNAAGSSPGRGRSGATVRHAGVAETMRSRVQAMMSGNNSSSICAIRSFRASFCFFRRRTVS